jgi:hypothetical protein
MNHAGRLDMYQYSCLLFIHRSQLQYYDRPGNNLNIGLKRQCHKIFCFLVFFHESSSPRPLKKHQGHFEICGQVKVHHRYQRIFAIGISGVTDTGGKFSTPALPVRHQWQIMGTISDCLHLKVNLKEKIYLFVNSTTHRCLFQTKQKIFSICRAVNISVNFQKNSKWSYWNIQGLGGNGFMKKT